MGPNPFKPTAGKMPPILIGRQAVIDDFTDGLRNGAGAPGRLMLVTGQRGFGKTVVLTELGNVARKAGWVEVAETASPGFVGRLVERLAATAHNGARITANPQLTVPMVGSLSLGSVEIGNTAAPSTLRDAINHRLKRMDKGHGILITLDEAQGADIDELVALGTAVQHVIRDQDATGLSDTDKWGVALVISALPSMVDDLLDQKVLTFLRRALREDLAEVPVPDVRNAYLKTVRENGAEISLEDAQMAAKASAGYPYMVQLVGYYMWQSADRKGADTIETDDVRQGIEDAGMAFEEAVCAPAFDRLTEPQRRFVIAMAKDSPKPSALVDVADRAGRSRGWAGKYRLSLIQEHVIRAEGRGLVGYAIPHFGPYVQRLLSTGVVSLD